MIKTVISIKLLVLSKPFNIGRLLSYNPNLPENLLKKINTFYFNLICFSLNRLNTTNIKICT